ncbi:TPA: hypothetical protein DCG86_02205 [Candidatus Marinimicrobia bacterium]|nr:hypothetical protein [Candidatus Neomarinimicrobiota bacterium]
MMKIFIKLICYIVLTGNFMGCQQNTHADSIIKGIKFYPEHSRCADAETCARSIHEAGFNSVFMPVLEKDLSDAAEFDLYAFRHELQKRDIRFTAVVQVFYDPVKWDEHPEWRALDQNRDDSPQSWQKMISPACVDFRKLKLDHINRIIRELNPDMLALDFIRYPVFWENVHVDSLHTITRRYDYNSLSISMFKNSFKVGSHLSGLPENLPSPEWESFKTHQITSFVRDVRAQVKDIPLILHILPWLEKEQEYYLTSTAGQDVDSLALYADFLSPMLYPMVPELSPERIGKMVMDFTTRHPDIYLLPSFHFSDTLSQSLLKEDIFNGHVLFHWELAEKSQGLFFK